ncbi:3'5'-cyclic nucleotide phosphodiesterase [Carpediemonas membranifera]|uniref:3'5'-cyclic nucleotide phosphodiesterase n=1 Tax=Carpediemonas membranifera TaxID=201153 RepID=A0A8J6ARX4_9EUKA|nr:3'5'-cyclic nucleotide phosphodiesterase [Carpediemonas membranifera]|eukprot:KAG9392503.1 3'5'-cyclic nucleotide phosphodiesterase [Carpediemonas membranifera]
MSTSDTSTKTQDTSLPFQTFHPSFDPTTSVLFLIVDDDPVVRRRMRFLVNKFKQETDAILDVDDGLVAAEIVKAIGGHLRVCIFLDVQMPIFDARRFLRLMREDVPNTFVVAMSADRVHIHSHAFLLKRQIVSSAIKSTIWEARHYLSEHYQPVQSQKSSLVAKLMDRLEMIELLRPPEIEEPLAAFNDTVTRGQLLFGSGAHSQLSRWDFDITSVASRDLAAIPVCIMVETGLFDHSQDIFVPRRAFYRMVRLLETQGYRRNHYHNFRHAVDVMQACYAFVTDPAVPPGMFTRTDMLVLFVAALSHDVGHVGQTNVQLTASGNILAMIYSSSVLESFHCSYFMRIQNNNAYALFHHLPHELKCDILRRIVSLILCTDMAYHGTILQTARDRVAGRVAPSEAIALIPAFRTHRYRVKSATTPRPSSIRRGSEQTSGSGASNEDAVHGPLSVGSLDDDASSAERRMSVISLDSRTDEGSDVEFDGPTDLALSDADSDTVWPAWSLDYPEDRLLLLVLILKAADISNSVRAGHVASYWSGMIAAEAGLKDIAQCRKLTLSFMVDFVRGLYVELRDMGVVSQSVLDRLNANIQRQRTAHTRRLSVGRVAATP